MPLTQLTLPLGIGTLLERLAATCGLPPRRPPVIPKAPAAAGSISKSGIEVRVVRHPRARRYLLRLQPDGAARLVIPRRGSRREALRFLDRNEAWLLERFRRWQARRPTPRIWADGTTLFFRGEAVRLSVLEGPTGVQLRFADQIIDARLGADFGMEVRLRLRSIAEEELPRRTRELARLHDITIQRVTIRAQKTRWGSCSARGTISLNWRLIQAPPSVQDYLIIHELMHRRQMNHSVRFWNLVAKACPDYQLAEQWLKRTRLEEMD